MRTATLFAAILFFCATSLVAADGAAPKGPTKKTATPKAAPKPSDFQLPDGLMQAIKVKGQIYKLRREKLRELVRGSFGKVHEIKWSPVYGYQGEKKIVVIVMKYRYVKQAAGDGKENEDGARAKKKAVVGFAGLLITGKELLKYSGSGLVRPNLLAKEIEAYAASQGAIPAKKKTPPGPPVANTDGKPKEPGQREWTTADDIFTAQAVLVDFSDGVVHLKLADGKLGKVKIDNLSQPDRDFVRKKFPESK